MQKDLAFLVHIIRLIYRIVNIMWIISFFEHKNSAKFELGRCFYVILLGAEKFYARSLKK